MFLFKFSFSILIGLFVIAFVSSNSFALKQKANILIVLDGSGSMGKEIGGVSKIDTVKEGLEKEIKKFPVGTSVGLISFGHQEKGSCEDVENILPISPLKKGEFSSSLEKITPQGKTPLFLSLKKAINELTLTRGESTLLLIADGQDTCGGNPCELVKDMRNSRIKTVIDIIGFGVSRSEKEQLECVASAGAGTYFPVSNAEEFQLATEKIFDRAFKKKRKSVASGQIQTTKRIYRSGEKIRANYSYLPGNSRDWVSIVKAQKPDSQYVSWTFTSGKRKGEFSAKDLPPGEYEARLYLDWPDGGYKVQDRYRFKILPSSGRVVFKTTKKTYAPGEEIVVEFSRLPGNNRDWITVVESTAPKSRQGQLYYTQGQVKGKFNFKPLEPGEYEARLYYDWPKGGYRVHSTYDFLVKDQSFEKPPDEESNR